MLLISTTRIIHFPFSFRSSLGGRKRAAAEPEAGQSRSKKAREKQSEAE